MKHYVIFYIQGRRYWCVRVEGGGGGGGEGGCCRP